MKLTIKNRKNQNIAVLVEEAENQKGLAFAMHGLSAYKEQPQLAVIAEAFRDNNYTVVRFDTTNTFGESDGNPEDATTTNYYEDLEDAVAWAGLQSWYQEPFYLAGQSLGGFSAGFYAENFPSKVGGVILQSAMISGPLSLQNRKARSPEIVEEWQRTGWLSTPSNSRPGLIKRLKWSHMEDRIKHDLFPKAHALTMPVLMIFGDQDPGCPPEQQRMLYNIFPGKKEFHIVKGAPHDFTASEHLEESKKVIDRWIQKLD